MFSEDSYQGGDEAEPRETNEQPLFDKSPLILCGKTVPGNSNLKARKSVAFCFYKLKAK